MIVDRWMVRTEGGSVVGPRAMDLTGIRVIFSRTDSDGLMEQLTIEPGRKADGEPRVYVSRAHFREGRRVAVFPRLSFEPEAAHVLGEIVALFGVAMSQVSQAKPEET